MNNFDEELAKFKDIVFNQPIIKEYFKIKKWHNIISEKSSDTI